MFFMYPTGAVHAGDYSDEQISAFGSTALVPLTFRRRSMEFAPTLLQLWLSVDTITSVTLRLFFAAAVGADADDQIEIFNQVIIVGPIPVGIYAGFSGGQGGCQRVWRDNVTGVPWTLRASTTGLAGLDSRFRGEWIWARGAV